MKPGTIGSGINVIGPVPWGTHFGLFYRTKEDLTNVLVPYFEAGLNNNELCLWVTAEPLNAEEANTLMAGAMPGFNEYLESGQIEIIPHTELYKIDDVFDGTRVINRLIDKLREARERGFRGLRASGNESWLEKSDWKDFIDYEQSINDVIGQHNMLALCTYSLEMCDANDILDVVSTHQFVLIRRNDEWKTIEDHGQKKARKALRESEEKFRVLAETSSAMFWLYQGERFVDVNVAGERLTGYTIDELLGMRFWDVVHPDDRELVRERGLARQRGEPVPNKYDVKLLTKGGETRWAELTAGRIMYRGGPAGIATFFDITERKQVEEALKDSKVQAELYLDLMGHDINNMHQIALGYLELALEMQVEGEPTEFLDKTIEVLQRSSQLIKNVRKLQKLREGIFHTREINVTKVLADLCRQFGAVPHKSVTLNLDEHRPSYVRANELLHDVFANLVSNAIKHTGENANIVVDLDLVRDRGIQYCRVFVADSGPGIPDDFKGKIFNRLLTGTDKAKGMGLGLYLVKSLVESYGGRVWAEDRVPGDYTKGAKFVVLLPAAE